MLIKEQESKHNLINRSKICLSSQLNVINSKEQIIVEKKYEIDKLKSYLINYDEQQEKINLLYTNCLEEIDELKTEINNLKAHETQTFKDRKSKFK